MRSNQKGFIDPLSLFAIGFLVVSLIAGAVAVNNRNTNYNISNKASGVCTCTDASGHASIGGSCSGANCTCPSGLSVKSSSCSLNTTAPATPPPQPPPNCNTGNCMSDCLCNGNAASYCGSACTAATTVPTVPPTLPPTPTVPPIQNGKCCPSDPSIPTQVYTCAGLTNSRCGDFSYCSWLSACPTPTPTPTPIPGKCCPVDPSNSSQVYTCAGLTNSRCGDFSYCSWLFSCPTPIPSPTPPPGKCCPVDPSNSSQVYTCAGLTNSRCGDFSYCQWNYNNNCSQSVPTPTPTPVFTPLPTLTPAPTPKTTLTPRVPVSTPTPTSTPIKTATPTPKATPVTEDRCQANIGIYSQIIRACSSSKLTCDAKTGIWTCLTTTPETTPVSTPLSCGSLGSRPTSQGCCNNLDVVDGICTTPPGTPVPTPFINCGQQCQALADRGPTTYADCLSLCDNPQPTTYTCTQKTGQFCSSFCPSGNYCGTGSCEPGTGNCCGPCSSPGPTNPPSGSLDSCGHQALCINLNCPTICPSKNVVGPVCQCGDTNPNACNVNTTVLSHARVAAPNGVQLDPTYVPPNLVNIKTSIPEAIYPNYDIEIEQEAVSYIKGFVDEMIQNGYIPQITYGYRSYAFQEGLHKNNPGTAAAGNSQHQTGLAIDIQRYGKVDANGNTQWFETCTSDLPGCESTHLAITTAAKYGIAHPMGWDAPHFFVAIAACPEIMEYLKSVANPTANYYDELNKQIGKAQASCLNTF